MITLLELIRGVLESKIVVRYLHATVQRYKLNEKISSILEMPNV